MNLTYDLTKIATKREGEERRKGRKYDGGRNNEEENSKIG